MTSKAWESDSQDKGRESGAGKLNDLKDGYRETSRMNLFLAKEAVFSDEEVSRLLLRGNDG
jgi:hypothetical protein